MPARCSHCGGQQRLRDKVDGRAAWVQEKYEALNGAMESGNTQDLSAVGRSFLEAESTLLPYDMWRAGGSATNMV